MSRRAWPGGPCALLAVLLSCPLLGTGVAAAQPAPAVSTPGPDVERILPAPYTDPVRSLALLAELRSLHPGSVALHLAAAREATGLGLVATDRDEAMARFRDAVDAARSAAALDPDRADTSYWLAASLGLQADLESGRGKISLAQEAYTLAQRTLELDPHHGGAHHIVGRLHNGAKRLSWVSRLIARGLGLGEILNQASWESAEHHLRLAVAYDPDPLVHHLELAKLLLHREGLTEGQAILAELAVRTPRHAVDERVIQEAKILLHDLRN